jgi:hypothetical protein
MIFVLVEKICLISNKMILFNEMSIKIFLQINRQKLWLSKNVAKAD